MNSKSALRRLATTLAGGVVLTAAPAGARPLEPVATEAPPAPANEDENDERDDILVTGERERSNGRAGAKTDTPLIILPQTVTVIDQDELTRRNALSINQALGYVAGVAPNQRGNVATRYDQLFLRGFTPGVFMDGMRQQGGVYSSPQTDFHLVESVDVIKGPASVLYGSGTPGGLVNLTSKLPGAEAGSRIELASGNFALLRSAIDLNQPLDRDGRWQFRVIAGAEQGDGFLQHTRNRRYYARPMLRFAPDDATSVTLILSYQRDPEAASYSGVPVYGSALPNPFGRFPIDLNVSEPGYEAFDRKQKSATLLFRHRLSDALTWTTNARYYDVDLHYRQIYLSAFRTTGTGAARTTDFSTIVRGGGGSDERFRTITLDNRLAAEVTTGPVRHVLLAGLDYAHNEGRNDQQFNTGRTADPVTSIPDFDLFRPRYNGTLPGFALTQTRSFRRIDQTGAYVQDQLSLGGLNLIASGRWDWYDQLTRNRTTGAVTRSSQTAFTTRIGALHETSAGLAPFASYAKSFEPQTGAGADGAPFVPVTGRQYEAGIKFQPRGGGALFTLSAFDLRRQNVPVSDPANPNFSIQVGEVKVRGIELDGRGTVARGVTLALAASYTDPLVTSGTVPVGSGDQLSGVTGTRPLGVPRWSASSFVSSDLGDAVAGGLGGLSLGAGVRYVGESDGTASYARGAATSVERFASPGYVLADALLGYDLGALDRRWDGLSLSVNASNLFDKRHTASCFFNNSCYFGAARTLVGTLRFNW
ncbi:TonB-dependent siderophore receptor [Sphingomonas sp. DT-51]|uniref:TonB-dependent siderophore receptor n=1 Tax=Sphingomonas sp. DT-51 TaxID=3396165 RepID=UPI003F1D8969